MTRSLLILTAVAALLGFGAAQLWSRGAGGGAAVLVMVIGATVVVLRRNQSDLRELELTQPDEEEDEVDQLQL